MNHLISSLKILIIYVLLTTNIYAKENIVYVDMNTIINTSKAGLSINNQIKKLIDQNNKDYEKLEKSLVKEENDLLKKKNVTDPQKFNEEIKNFQNKIKNFRSKRQKSVENIQGKNIKAKQELVTHITKILAEYSTKNEISLILNKESIVIGKKDIEITEKILELLNKKIKTIKLKS